MTPLLRLSPAIIVLLSLCLGLALTEAVLRLDLGGRTSQHGVDHPIVLLGTSRSGFGLSPAVIEDELAALGEPAPWSINLSRPSLTNVGLYQRYLDMIGPPSEASWSGGVLAIELRGAGMNDGFLLPDERRFVRSSEAGAALRARPGKRPFDGESVVALLRSGDLEGAAAVLFSSLRIAQLDATQLGWIRPWLRPGWGEDAGFAALGASARKGWNPILEPRRDDLQEAFWRRRYRNNLQGYRLGGVQTRAIAALIETARDAGLTPVLYILPVTAMQRGFFAEGDYERFLQAARALADREGVALFDFDSGHTFRLDQFHDVNHLSTAASDPMSRQFARRVLAPILARQREQTAE